MATTKPEAKLARPPYDPELAVIRDTFPPFGPITNELIIAHHQDPSLYGPLPSVSDLIKGRPIVHKEYEIAGFKADDPPILLSVFSPTPSTVDDTALRPCVYFMHGGGMIFLDRHVGLEQPLDWVMETGCVLVSVEYRLAPENPQPAALHDCYAGLTWVHSHAAELTVDRARIMVAGHSGGSGLAAGIALFARDRADGPGICAQLLACPMIDDSNTSVSSRQFEDAEPWDRKSNVAAWAAVLEHRGDDYGSAVSPYFAPMRAKDLSGLPPAWIDVGSTDVFRDEAVSYASRLWVAGVQAELHVWPGGFHGFDMMAPNSALGQKAAGAKMNWVKGIFGVH
jgi:acetyl esterase/lipase